MEINYNGKGVSLSIWGGSHQPELGVSIKGLPEGSVFSYKELNAFMSRRMSDITSFSIVQNNQNVVYLKNGGDLSGDNITVTKPVLSLYIKNKDFQSNGYSDYARFPRPGHGDFAAVNKYGPQVDLRGGGAFSGRMTDCICMAGGLLLQLLEKKNVHICAHLYSILNIKDDSFFNLTPTEVIFDYLKGKTYPTIDDDIKAHHLTLFEKYRAEGDSLGGIIEFAIIGAEKLGGPLFSGLESSLSSTLFAIPGAKGVEFGSGFNSAQLTGSECNDSFTIVDNKVFTKTNNHGGILGGVGTTMPIIGKVAFKPTPSIAKPQETVDLANMIEKPLVLKGVHDVCYVPRAVPVVEAMIAISIYNRLHG